MNYTSNVIKIEDSDSENDQKCSELRSVNGTKFQHITLLKSERIKKPKSIADASDPKFLEPFQYGWQRELVYRATTSPKIAADVYYRSPTRTKMRSMREVSEYLKKYKMYHLTLDNFTFMRTSLGTDDPNLEIIRTAKKTERRREVHKLEKFAKTRIKRKYVRKNAPKPVDIDITNGFDKDITNLPDITMQATNEKPAKCFRAITDPDLRKPFLYDWKREVIFHTNDDDPNRRVDANYITPNGQRVKTLNKIAQYLEETNCKDLAASNFTFCGGPLGLNDPTKEIIIKAYLYETNNKKVVPQNVVADAAPPLQDPKLLKPFLYGWRRELVYRIALVSQSNHADAYYFAPTGEKLRAMTEIAQYLSKIGCKELGVENFNFFKRPLGVNDPEKETIRTANINRALRKLGAKVKVRNFEQIEQQTKTKRKYTKRKQT